jgi:hypothetical protein
MNRLSSNLPTSGQTQKDNRSGYIFRLRDTVEQVLQRTAGSHALEGFRVSYDFGHGSSSDPRSDSIHVDIMDA